MNKEHLLAAFENDERTHQIVSQGAATASKMYLSGLIASSAAFVAQAVIKKSRNAHVFILKDAEEAAYFQNELKNLLNDDKQKHDVLFFPDSFKKPGQIHQLNNANVQLRTECINHITNPTAKAEIIVSYPDALFEKVVKKTVLKKNMISMKINEKLNVDFMVELLVTYGFEHADFVYEPGQFSIRGDIVDVFSFANELPYRIEMFDDVVESIRIFDPSTQLSQRKVERITIIPNVQTHFSEEEKTSFFDILTPKTSVWVKDIPLLIDALDENMTAAIEVFEELQKQKERVYEENNPFLKQHPKDIFEAPASILSGMQLFNLIEFGKKAYFESATEIVYHISQQTHFNKNFDLFIKNLTEHEAQHIENYIFAENPKQIERFYAIFEDLKATVQFTPIYTSIHEGFIENDLKLAVYTDHQIFNRYHKYQIRQGYSKDKALILKTLNELRPGDYVTHIDHGVGRYSGLEKIAVGGKMQECVRLIYDGGDLLYVGINSLHKIAKFTGKEGQVPKTHKLGSDTWEKVKTKTKKKIKDIAADLIKLYALRKTKKGYAFAPDSYLQNELEASFIYEDTPDQEKCTHEVKNDMEKPTPMDRLICGDVGFGKTEVAIRAAYKAVADGKQVVVLVPTTILAYQHFQTFSERLADFGVTIDYVNRFRSTKEKTAILNQLKEGKIDIIIGTHGIVAKTVKFKDLGLLIVDEEQKFGVGVKDRLKEIKVNVDTLTLTATPIPRTLQFSLMSARDLSIMQTPPPNRQPVATEVRTFNPEVIKDAVEYEVYRGGQVFFVHNRVKDLEDLKAMIHKYLPDIAIATAHGQMEGHLLEKVMKDFVEKKYDVLISTNIIETGLDIPNANTIIINNAHMFGLSDLHQLRGRVGRSNKKAFAYLFSPPLSTLTKDARQRLKTLEEFSELGSGFNIAMRDLDIRGAGNLLGGEQSGFISEIGFETYHKILDEAIQELKETDFADVYEEEMKERRIYVRDCQIDTDLELLIPDEYVNKVDERMLLYTALDNLKNEEELKTFALNLKDRFGEIPEQVIELFNAMRIKWLATALAMERVWIKQGKMNCYFLQNQQSAFYSSAVFGNIIQYITSHPQAVKMKETDKYLVLTFLDVQTMKQAQEKLNVVSAFVYEGV